MPEPVTLEQVEELATQLSLAERLKLVARVCEQLSVVLPAMVPEEQAKEGEFDSAAEVRRMRDER